MNVQESPAPPVLSVILCTHNPAPDRIRRAMTALRAQTLPSHDWETLVVDNASTSAFALSAFADCAPANCLLIQEPVLGLSTARRSGLRAARGAIVVFVDDDNVLAPDYLAETLAAFARLPQVGALGGKSIPEFTTPVSPDDWRREFFPLLALRDLGDEEKISCGLRPPGSVRNVYPEFAPIGAGLALRRAAVASWLERDLPALSDRRGTELSSAGDNEIVLSIMQAGWEAAYIPALTLTHLIPASRLEPAYLGRLNEAIQRSWMRVLALHDANPWSPLSPFDAKLRILKAWLVSRAWSRTPARRIRWLGTRGHFNGRTPSKKRS